MSRRLAALAWASALACHRPTEPAGLELGQRGEGLAGANVEASQRGVLALVSVTPETVELCTGTLLAPNLLITARHCISDTSLDSLSCESTPAFFGPPLETRSLWVNHSGALSGPLQSFGLLPLTGGADEFVAVAAVQVPDTNVVCGGDVALLILEESIAADLAEPLAPRLDEPVTTGETYTAVGFGATLDSGALGTRRARGGLEASCGGDDCQGRTNLAANEFRGGDGVCAGDSGGARPRRRWARHRHRIAQHRLRQLRVLGGIRLARPDSSRRAGSAIARRLPGAGMARRAPDGRGRRHPNSASALQRWRAHGSANARPRRARHRN